MAPDTSIPLMEQLRIATRELHERLGSLGYFQALLNHTLPLESYVGQLRDGSRPRRLGTTPVGPGSTDDLLRLA